MKRNLIILLLIPFLLTLLGIVTINTTFNYISNDIIDINWKYDDIEAFELQGGRYLLEATGVSEKDYPASAGNDLVWSIQNKDGSEENIAIIEQEGSRFYLKALGIGEVIVTCSNQKGNISRSFTALIIDGTYVLIKAEINSSQNNIDPKIYYGSYDLKESEKVDATVKFKIDTNNATIFEDLYVKEQTDGIEVDLENLSVKIKQNSNSLESFTLDSKGNEITNNPTFNMNIINGGVNVYTYQDLLDCTNNSENGEIVVLRKSFESLNNYRISTNNNVELFGVAKNSKFDFSNDVYRFKTTMCTDYIDNWNKNSNQKISSDIICGLHVQKDFYGNGYTINLHNLTYPTAVTEVISQTGEIVKVPTLASSDLFRGPLPIYTLGNHNNTPLIEAFGQDNIGMYVNGNDILINDLNLKNCDFGNILSNLRYTGTVLETYGENITIKNSKISNGKNVVRSYSSMNAVIKNCMVSNAFNFLVSVGCNEYISIDDEKEYDFIDLDGNVNRSKVKNYLQKEAIGDEILNNFIIEQFSDKEKMRQSLISIQKALNEETLIANKFKGTLEVVDTMFYRSGIASISIDTMFNGPFIYGGVPSYVAQLLELLNVSYIPNHIGGLSYPVKVDIKGTTKFYDYKTSNELDISGLINENISVFASEAGDQIGMDYNGTITIDTIFPLKSYLMANCPQYKVLDKTYVNIPVAFYGGSLNMSVVNVDTLEMKESLSAEIYVDLLDEYLDLKSNNTYGTLKNAMMKCVTIVTGFEPFKFICTDDSGYLFGQTPQVSELVENAKKESSK